MITTYDVLPQDEICEICYHRIGDHQKIGLWKCLQYSSLCIKNIKHETKTWCKPTKLQDCEDRE